MRTEWTTTVAMGLIVSVVGLSVGFPLPGCRSQPKTGPLFETVYLGDCWTDIKSRAEFESLGSLHGLTEYEKVSDPETKHRNEELRTTYFIMVSPVGKVTAKAKIAYDGGKVRRDLTIDPAGLRELWDIQRPVSSAPARTSEDRCASKPTDTRIHDLLGTWIRRNDIQTRSDWVWLSLALDGWPFGQPYYDPTIHMGQQSVSRDDLEKRLAKNEVADNVVMFETREE